MTSASSPRPVSALRARMIEDMTVRGFTEETHSNYIREVRAFAAFIRRPPDTATAEDLRRFQLHQTQSGMQPPSINSSVSALRFFFTVTLDRPDLARRLTVVRQPRRLPAVLSVEEMTLLLQAAPGPKYKAAFATAYGAGLRVSEVVALKVGDIDSERMLLRVEQGKGRKDRDAMLSPQLLELLRDWWVEGRRRGVLLPRGWLFPGRNPIEPLSTRQLNRAVHAAAEAAGIRKRVSPHGLVAVYQRPNTSKPATAHKVYPYLLGGLSIERVNQVWCSDITYIPMAKGFLYLVVIMDWHSRAVLAWRLSNTLGADFCVEAIEEALAWFGRPEIFNTDQGSQFTGEEFIGELQRHEITISMDGKGRYMDNIFIERLWRSLKYEEVYLHAYANVAEAKTGIATWLRFYNEERQHQSHGYRTPRQVYEGQSRWVCGRSASPTGSASPASRASSESGEMLAFAHIPTGTTDSNRINIDDLEGRTNLITVALAATGAETEIGRATP